MFHFLHQHRAFRQVILCTGDKNGVTTLCIEKGYLNDDVEKCERNVSKWINIQLSKINIFAIIRVTLFLVKVFNKLSAQVFNEWSLNTNDNQQTWAWAWWWACLLRARVHKYRQEKAGEKKIIGEVKREEKKEECLRDFHTWSHLQY